MDSSVASADNSRTIAASARRTRTCRSARLGLATTTTLVAEVRCGRRTNGQAPPVDMRAGCRTGRPAAVSRRRHRRRLDRSQPHRCAEAVEPLLHGMPIVVCRRPQNVAPERNQLAEPTHAQQVIIVRILSIDRLLEAWGGDHERLVNRHHLDHGREHPQVVPVGRPARDSSGHAVAQRLDRYEGLTWPSPRRWAGSSRPLRLHGANGECPWPTAT